MSDTNIYEGPHGRVWRHDGQIALSTNTPMSLAADLADALEAMQRRAEAAEADMAAGDVENKRLTTALEACRDCDTSAENPHMKTPKRIATDALAGHKCIAQQRWEWQGERIQELQAQSTARRLALADLLTFVEQIHEFIQRHGDKTRITIDGPLADAKEYQQAKAALEQDAGKDLREQLNATQEKLSEREAFKSYVHDRLDQAGVPSFDDGRACRIGARLDWLLERHQRLAALDSFEGVLALLRSILDERYPPEIFAGGSEDVGPQLVARARDIINRLNGLGIDDVVKLTAENNRLKRELAEATRQPTVEGYGRLLDWERSRTGPRDLEGAD